MRFFASLRMTGRQSVILSEAKNLIVGWLLDLSHHFLTLTNDAPTGVHRLPIESLSNDSASERVHEFVSSLVHWFTDFTDSKLRHVSH
jgi:hypothetical protein